MVDAAPQVKDSKTALSAPRALQGTLARQLALPAFLALLVIGLQHLAKQRAQVVPLVATHLRLA
jgi:hypothetical protein